MKWCIRNHWLCWYWPLSASTLLSLSVFQVAVSYANNTQCQLAYIITYVATEDANCKLNKTSCTMWYNNNKQSVLYRTAKKATDRNRMIITVFQWNTINQRSCKQKREKCLPASNLQKLEECHEFVSIGDSLCDLKSYMITVTAQWLFLK